MLQNVFAFSFQHLPSIVRFAQSPNSDVGSEKRRYYEHSASQAALKFDFVQLSK